MAKKMVDSRRLAVEALAKLLGDPTPRVLFGTAKQPGVFKGSAEAVKNAARLCIDNSV